MNVTRTTLWGLALAIFAGTLWVHWPAVNGGFLTRMDDDVYLRQAVRLKGLTWNAVRWAFTTTRPYYHPLPRLSHILDYQIWRTNAAGHHATSMVLHALNAALVFGFLWTLLTAASLAASERLAVALSVAVVLAIHPLQVESVAWISGRTQLLCTAFGIGCLWAYVAGARRWVVWTLYVAALLSKPMAVSLPLVMLAMDHWEQALRIQPDYIEAHDNLGVALVRLGKPQAAIKHWEQVLRTQPDYAEVHYNLGTVFEQTGEIANAVGHDEQALRIKPDYTEAQNRLARLRAVQ